MNDYDFLILGQGLVGLSMALKLAGQGYKVMAYEANLDLCRGASGRNSGVVHAGFYYEPGSLKARMCLEGNLKFSALAEELGLPFRRTGKLLLAFSADDEKELSRLYARGLENGCPDLRLVRGRELHQMAGYEAPSSFGLWSPRTMIVDPFQYVIRAAEKARRLGAVLLRGQGLARPDFVGGKWSLRLGREKYSAACLINCGGLWALENAAVLNPPYKASFHKGHYLVLDEGDFPRLPIYPAPNPGVGLGVHLTPTLDGKLLIGPDAWPAESVADYAFNPEAFEGLWQGAERLFPGIARSGQIKTFVGLRARLVHADTGRPPDFLIESHDQSRSLHFLNIESPGLTSAAPMAEEAFEILKKKNFWDLPLPAHWQGEAWGLESPSGQGDDNANQGPIICRCRGLGRGVVERALKSPLAPRTLSGIKYHTGAMMGRCQGSFCQSRIVALMEAAGVREDGLADDRLGPLSHEPSAWLFSKKVRQ